MMLLFMWHCRRHWKCNRGREVKASDSKSDSLWERRFESCRLRTFLASFSFVSSSKMYKKSLAGWRYGGSNPRPSKCESDALPLSYIPISLLFDFHLCLTTFCTPGKHWCCMLWWLTLACIHTQLADRLGIVGAVGLTKQNVNNSVDHSSHVLASAVHILKLERYRED